MVFGLANIAVMSETIIGGSDIKVMRGVLCISGLLGEFVSAFVLAVAICDCRGAMDKTGDSKRHRISWPLTIMVWCALWS